MNDDSPLSNGDMAIPHGDLRVWNLLEQKDTAKYEREMDGQRRYHRTDVYILTKFNHSDILTVFGACFFEQHESWSIWEAAFFEWLHKTWTFMERATEVCITPHISHSSFVLFRKIDERRGGTRRG